MKIAVIGSEGNMGRRYQAILRYLQHEIVPIDINIPGSIEGCDGVIIASPTDTHADYLRFLNKFDIPILCEKPIICDYGKLEKIIYNFKTNIRMVNQYEFFDIEKAYLPRESNVIKLDEIEYSTIYDYYKSGSDKLCWDCINIIGLARGKTKINCNSPIWNCVLNGNRLDLRMMDYAYVWNVDDWLSNFNSNIAYIMHSHQKVQELIDGSGCNCNTD